MANEKEYFKNIQKICPSFNLDIISQILNNKLKNCKEINSCLFNYIESLSSSDINFDILNNYFKNDNNNSIKTSYIPIMEKNEQLYNLKPFLTPDTLKFFNIQGIDKIKNNSLYYYVLYLIDKYKKENTYLEKTNKINLGFNDKITIIKYIENYLIIQSLYIILVKYFTNLYNGNNDAIFYVIEKEKFKILKDYLIYREKYKNIEYLEKYSKIEIPDSITNFFINILNNGLDYLGIGVKTEDSNETYKNELIYDIEETNNGIILNIEYEPRYTQKGGNANNDLKISRDDKNKTNFIHELIKRNPEYSDSLLVAYNESNNPRLKPLIALGIKPEDSDIIDHMYKNKNYVIDPKLQEFYTSSFINNLTNKDDTIEKQIIPEDIQKIPKVDLSKEMQQTYTEKNLRKVNDDCCIDYVAMYKEIKDVDPSSISNNSLGLKYGDYLIFTGMELIDTIKKSCNNTGSSNSNGNNKYNSLTLNLPGAKSIKIDDLAKININ